LRLLYTAHLEPLCERFLKADSSVIDEVIVFLEVDVPAFQSGYNKEWYFKALKKLPLSEKQIEKLRNLALLRCASNEYRREDSELRRLMIRLADIESKPWSSRVHRARNRESKVTRRGCFKQY
jgi:hypothetical protein